MEDLFKGTKDYGEPVSKKKKRVRIKENDKRYLTRLSSTDIGTDSVFEDEDMSDIDRKLIELRSRRNGQVTIPPQSPDPVEREWLHGSAGLPKVGSWIQVRRPDGSLTAGTVHRLPRPGSSSRLMTLTSGESNHRETMDTLDIRYRYLEGKLRSLVREFNKHR